MQKTQSLLLLSYIFLIITIHNPMSGALAPEKKAPCADSLYNLLANDPKANREKVNALLAEYSAHQSRCIAEAQNIAATKNDARTLAALGKLEQAQSPLWRPLKMIVGGALVVGGAVTLYVAAVSAYFQSIYDQATKRAEENKKDPSKWH